VSEIYHEWRTVVVLYSRMKLTFLADAIVALSGLAQLVQNATRDEYFAGLWRNDIAHQLFWERIGTTDLRGVLREVRRSQLELGFYGMHGDVGSVPVMGRGYPPPVPRILRFLHRYGGYQASPQQEKTLLHLKARIFTFQHPLGQFIRFILLVSS
jgi:hypothetical protein